MTRNVFLLSIVQHILWVCLGLMFSAIVFASKNIKVPLVQIIYVYDAPQKDSSYCTHITIPIGSLAESLLLFYSTVPINKLCETIKDQSLGEGSRVLHPEKTKMLKYLSYQLPLPRSTFERMCLAGTGAESIVITYPRFELLMSFIKNIMSYDETITTASAIYSILSYSYSYPNHKLARKFSRLLLFPMSQQQCTDNSLAKLLEESFGAKSVCPNNKKAPTITVKTKQKSDNLSYSRNSNMHGSVTGAFALVLSQINSAIGRKLPARPIPCNATDSLNQCRCDHNDFLCSSAPKCIDIHRQCDGVNDCPNGEDESEACNIKVGSGNEDDLIRCTTDKRLLDKSVKCNGIPDCRDNSDELDCPCQGLPSCDNGKCLRGFSSVCNAYKDCADGSDENNCATHILPNNLGVYCPPNVKAGQCVEWLKEKWCRTGDYNFRSMDLLREFSFENLYNNNSLAFTLVGRYKSYSELLGIEKSCGKYNDASMDENVYVCNASLSSTLGLLESKHICLTESDLCDGVVDCPGGIDESPRFCSLKCEYSEYACGDGHCIPSEKVMDGIFDCANHMDEHPIRFIDADNRFKSHCRGDVSCEQDIIDEKYCKELTDYTDSANPWVDTTSSCTACFFQAGLPAVITAVIAGSVLFCVSYAISRNHKKYFPNIVLKVLGHPIAIASDKTINLSTIGAKKLEAE
ncbi:MAG: hypothetical protein QS721_15055 [Candidatus Endonucleobacter sp. (ex Gigantidas childressi)]|nr:hypothetical protein [Candidatus Endonucleobacter sp. (ex Gigantidas childressi)]